MIRIKGYALHRAHLLALRYIEVTDALGAAGWIDLVDFFTLEDSAIGAGRFAYVAIDAIVGNHECHWERSWLPERELNCDAPFLQSL
jgi:hypothetical protein